MKWARRLGYKISEEDIGEQIDLEKARPFLEGVEDSMQKAVPVYVVDVRLPKGFIPLEDEPKSAYAKWIEKMAIRKHLSLKDFIRAGVGFTRKDDWEPFAIFPVMEWDKLVYYQGRTYNEEPGEVTKKFPSRQQVPYGSRYWVYNVDALRDKSVTRVIVVESILNVLSLKREIRRLGVEGVAPVCIFKHAISPTQATKLRAFRHVEEFCLMFDEDATADAWRSVSKNLRDRSESGVEFTVAEMPEGVDANDDAELAIKRFHKRKKAGKLSQLDWEVLGMGAE